MDSINRCRECDDLREDECSGYCRRCYQEAVARHTCYWCSVISADELPVAGPTPDDQHPTCKFCIHKMRER